MFRSKSIAQCYYCDAEIRRDRLHAHTINKHPGRPKMEKSQKGAQSIKSVFERSRAADIGEATDAPSTSAVLPASEQAVDDGATVDKGNGGNASSSGARQQSLQTEV